MKDANAGGSSGGSGKKLINLALQGGGAHGAFTWGVLDRLLEDGRLDIEAISGTSAGAMNAVVMADGFMRNGNEGARERLAEFWKAVSDSAKYSPIKRAPLDILMGNWTLDTSLGYIFYDLLNKVASPYELNPLNINPLKDLLEETVDFERVRNCRHPLLFISATNVETGRVKVFRRDRITPDVVMASACLPFLFQAVEIDGVPYWDGGYMGNPVLFPFHDHTKTRDYVIIQINPVYRKGTPRTAREIMNRVNEISFNSSLLQELRAIDFVRRLIDDGKLDGKEYKRVNVHTISAQEELAPLGSSSKLNAEWAFLKHLFDIGRRAGEAWIERTLTGGVEGANIREMYQGDGSEPRPRLLGGQRR
jgi:NTE family protein